MAEGEERWVVMATVGAPHGVRGAVKLTVFAEDPLGLRRYIPFRDQAGAFHKLTSVKRVGKSVVAQIAGVDDRDGAEALRGATLSVPRKRLPRPDPDEFYYVDLVGLEVRHVDGTPLGTVCAVDDFGAGDVLEITGTHNVLIPFTRQVVPVVDLEGGYLAVDPPAGLLDDPSEDGSDGDRREDAGDPPQDHAKAPGGSPGDPGHAAPPDAGAACLPVDVDGREPGGRRKDETR